MTDGRVTRLREWSGPVALKPVDGAGGKGFALHDDLDAALAAAPATGSYLVQEKVVNDPYAVDLFPGSLNTLRIFAIRDAPGEPVRFPLVVQRIGSRATAPLDSFSAGGLLARVDLATGALTQAVGPVVRRGRDTFDHHPDTGARITGRVVPQLEEALDLVRRLMAAFPDALHIGWDVAISDRGPVVVEGNASRPAFRSAQAHGPFADDPSVRDFYVRHGFLPRRRRGWLNPAAPGARRAAAPGRRGALRPAGPARPPGRR